MAFRVLRPAEFEGVRRARHPFGAVAAIFLFGWNWNGSVGVINLPSGRVMAKDRLSTYKAKRDFALTQEPRGQAEVESSVRRRFVIQKHDATRLHYDLRLELDGVFKSWAVARGPSLDPHDKRLAVEVEDHPLDYGDFEGTIPEGQYGGGTVMLWDRGYWRPEGRMGPEQALAKGELKFVLDGERLHGGFVLVRMANDRAGSKRTNWLLIKHCDDFSVQKNGASALEDNDTSVASGRDMKAIAAGKGRKPEPFMLSDRAVAADVFWDGRNGAAAEARTTGEPTNRKRSAVAAVRLPEFIPPQLCQTVERPPSARGWIHEIKFDGYRIQLRVLDGEATLKTARVSTGPQGTQASRAPPASCRTRSSMARCAPSTNMARRTSQRFRPRSPKARPTPSSISLSICFSRAARISENCR